MFIKLIKHDIRDSFLEVVFFCGLLLVTSLFVMFSTMTGIAFWMIVSWLAYSAAATVLAVVVIKVIVYKFHAKLFGSGGYLTLTTPVSINKILLSKILVSMLWLFVAAMAALASFFIISAGILGIAGVGSGFLLTGFFRVIAEFPLRTLQMVVVILAFCLSAIMTLLVVLALSNIGRSKRGRLLKGVFIYWGLQQAMGVVTVLIFMIFGPLIDRANLSGAAMFYVMTSMIAVMFLGWAIGFYFLSKWLIVKKIELE